MATEYNLSDKINSFLYKISFGYLGFRENNSDRNLSSFNYVNYKSRREMRVMPKSCGSKLEDKEFGNIIR